MDDTFYEGSGSFRMRRGGTAGEDATDNGASYRSSATATINGNVIGFRVAMVPEPSTGLLVIAGLLGLASWRRTRA